MHSGVRAIVLACLAWIVIAEEALWSTRPARAFAEQPSAALRILVGCLSAGCLSAGRSSQFPYGFPWCSRASRVFQLPSRGGPQSFRLWSPKLRRHPLQRPT